MRSTSSSEIQKFFWTSETRAATRDIKSQRLGEGARAPCTSCACIFSRACSKMSFPNCWGCAVRCVPKLRLRRSACFFWSHPVKQCFHTEYRHVTNTQRTYVKHYPFVSTSKGISTNTPATSLHDMFWTPPPSCPEPRPQQVCMKFFGHPKHARNMFASPFLEPPKHVRDKFASSFFGPPKHAFQKQVTSFSTVWVLRFCLPHFWTRNP